MNKILVGTDFSERSDRALRRATLLAKQTGAEICLIHVVDDDQPGWIVERERDAADQLLREQAKTVSAVDSVVCDSQVILGTPFLGIVKATQFEAVKLLVVGPHRRQALRDVFVGTTAERSIRAAACPVLMANKPPVAEYRHVLLTTDLSENSRHVANALSSLDILGNAQVSLLYVFHDLGVRMSRFHSMPPDEKKHSLQEGNDNAARQLTRFASALDLASFKQIVRHEDSTAAHEILSAGKELGADLIVVGTLGKTGLAKLLLGSVAGEVLRSADRDVLAVPQPRNTQPSPADRSE